MSTGISHAPRPSGLRRISPAMLAFREKADAYQGLQEGSLKPFQFLAAFQQALPYLRLPPKAFELVAWLFDMTHACDWQQGSRPISWPSARLQQEYLGLSAARVKVLNRALFEAGIFVIRDNAEGKRYGQRGPDGRILQAFGFDLSPLAQRHAEFLHIAEEARIERALVRSYRRQLTLVRKAILQAEAILTNTQNVLPEVTAWLTERDRLDLVCRRVRVSKDLRALLSQMQDVQTGLEDIIKSEREQQEQTKTSPAGLENKPYINTNTTLKHYPSKDTVIAFKRSSQHGPKAAISSFKAEAKPQEAASGKKSGLTQPAELLELAPELGQWVGASSPGWQDVIGAAGGPLRHSLGVSTTLWAQACRVMGREGATLALALVSAKPDGYFSSGPAGYFGGMVKKAEKGELFLERSLWALREAKWGKRPWVQ